MRHGPAIVGLRVPLQQWIPEMLKLSTELYRTDRKTAEGLAQLAATLITGCQLIDMVADKLVANPAETFGIQPPSA